ncbi:hypothetical protein M885DRAFT_624763 [Pelagophyceae sp. CCMP2097]|nr:hypothetical protein M885DRAFT_624763 [Pelagophyceae sp. CCMP2097]
MSSGGYRPAMGVEQFLATDVAKDGIPGQHKNLQVGTDFPIVCETCLGPNPYVRMIKLRMGDKLCKVANTPFPAFRWKAGPQGRFKETIVCREVAVEKNICQGCLTDMTFGVPVGVRDALLAAGASNELAVGGYADPKCASNQAYYYQEKKRAVEDGVAGGGALAIQQLEPSRELLSLARSIQAANAKGGTAFRNLSRVCTFWLGGTCNRVKEKRCPFRPCCGVFKFPELASSHPVECAALVEQLRQTGAEATMGALPDETRLLIKAAISGNREEAIRKRVAGGDDQSQKYIARATSRKQTLEAPQDATLTSLWVGGTEGSDVTEADLVDQFYQFGEVRAVRVMAACAFVEFATRQGAEAAAAAKFRTLNVRGKDLALDWAKPRSFGGEGGGEGGGPGLPPPGVAAGAAAPALRPELAAALAQWPAAAPAAGGAAAPAAPAADDGDEPSRKKARAPANPYPSMDPQRLGTAQRPPKAD